MGKHRYLHHAQMDRTFLSNLITLIDEYCGRVRIKLGYLTWLELGKGNIPNTYKI